MLLGRLSYKSFSQAWPSMADDFPGYNAMSKFVVSSSLGDTDTDKPLLELTENETYANGVQKLIYHVLR